MKPATVALNLDRILLAIYLVALFGLLTFPVALPNSHLLGIGADKYLHVVLFAGLALLLRWNLSANRYAVAISILVASAVAAATEIGQGFVAYRSADPWDFAAGVIGATLGAVGANRILASPSPRRTAGVVMAILGMMVGALFLLADLIGVGESRVFGTLQLAGTALGALISLGGIVVFIKDLHGESRRP